MRRGFSGTTALGMWVIWPERRKAWEYSARTASLFELEESTKRLSGSGVEMEIRIDEMWADMDHSNP